MFPLKKLARKELRTVDHTHPRSRLGRTLPGKLFSGREGNQMNQTINISIKSLWYITTFIVNCDGSAKTQSPT